MKLGGIDGDETARLFRENNKDTILVFCSGSRAPSDRSFKVLPFRYLLKSYSDAQMICEIREIFAEIEKKAAKQFILSSREFVVLHYSALRGMVAGHCTLNAL